MRHLSILLFCAGMNCLFFLHVQGQNATELTVEESVKMGLEHNYQLRVAEAEAEEAEAAYRQTQSGRLPSVTGQASYMRLSDNIPEVSFRPPGSDTTFTILPIELNQFHSEVSVEQLLFAGGRLNKQIDAAENQAESARLMQDQEKANVAFEIREAYWNLYHAIATNEATKTALAQVDEHLKNVRNRLDAGTALRTDLLSAQTRRSEVLLDQVDSQNQVRVARLELNRLIGLSPLEETQPVPPEQSAAVAYGIDELTEQALELRPELGALSRQVNAQEAEIDAKQGEWFPEISLVGRYVYARPNQYFFAQQDEFRGTWEAGVRLQWNIWSGGQRSAETSRIRARLNSSEAQLARMKEQVTVEVTRRYLELERAAEAIDVAAQSVESAEETFKSAQVQFGEGTALSEQVLDAEQAFRNAQASYARAVADFKIAQASILNSLGQVWGEQ